MGSEITRRPTLGPDIDETRVGPKTCMFCGPTESNCSRVRGHRYRRRLIYGGVMLSKNGNVEEFDHRRSIEPDSDTIRYS
jgi:hypothetical protein